MIAKLRRKFIAAAISSVALVLTVIMAVINTANYRSVVKNSDRLIELIQENGGDFPAVLAEEEKLPERDGMFGRGDRDKRFSGGELSPEMPFQTRYFTVSLKDGEALAANVGRIAAVTEEQAIDYAEQLFSEGKTSGFYGDYRYGLSSGGETSMYVFVDCRKELETFRAFLKASVLVSAGGLALVAGLVTLISGLVLRPAAESAAKQKRFITDASHELKTPLTIIEANTEVLEMESGENEWTESIRNQVKRLTSMTEKLVFLSRMDEEKKPQKERLDFSSLAQETADSFRAVAESKGKKLETHIENGLYVRGDSQMLIQLISLLLDNSVKYSDEGGSISLSLKSSGRNRILTVENTVESIRQGKLDEFFERFYREDSSRNSAAGGCGIGLSAAREIVSAHKGKITAFSDDGRSVRITAVLPA